MVWFHRKHASADITKPQQPGAGMTLGLHKDCKSRLTEKLKEILPNILVNNNVFLDYQSSLILKECDLIISNNKKIKPLFMEPISETPFYDFVHEYISGFLYDNFAYESEKEAFPLIQFKGFELEIFPTILVESFDSLPWKYTVFSPINESISKLFSRLDPVTILESNISFIKSTEEYNKSYPLLSGIENRDRTLFGYGLAMGFLGMGRRKWDAGVDYIKTEVTGFIGRNKTTTPLLVVQNRIKSIYGLMIAVRMADVAYSFEANPYLQKKSTLWIFKENEKSNIIERVYELDQNFSQGISNIIPLRNLDDYGSEDAKQKYMIYRLKTMFSVLSKPEKNERILLACQWIFDSHTNSDVVLAFVQSMIAIEILLGDKSTSDVIGLGELLSNRCAYLIGHNQTQREELLRDFKHLYSIRSSIVHQGKPYLTNHEQDSLFKLKWICYRIIQEEIKLLEKE